MNERTSLAASVLWLLASFLCLILPIFVPSSPNPADYLTDPISLSTGVMTVLSFPGGLLSLLFSPIIDFVFGIDPNSIMGMFLNLKLMFVLGLAQWFLIVPRILGRARQKRQQSLASTAQPAIPEGNMATAREYFDDASRTPVERIFDE